MFPNIFSLTTTCRHLCRSHLLLRNTGYNRDESQGLRRSKRRRFEKWVVVEKAVVYVVSIVARVSRVSQIEKESRVLHVIKRWAWTVATQAAESFDP